MYWRSWSVKLSVEKKPEGEYGKLAGLSDRCELVCRRRYLPRGDNLHIDPLPFFVIHSSFVCYRGRELLIRGHVLCLSLLCFRRRPICRRVAVLRLVAVVVVTTGEHRKRAVKATSSGVLGQ